MSHRVNAFRHASLIAVVLVAFLASLGPSGVALASHHHIYVGAQAGVRIFDADAVGNVSPERSSSQMMLATQ